MKIHCSFLCAFIAATSGGIHGCNGGIAAPSQAPDAGIATDGQAADLQKYVYDFSKFAYGPSKPPFGLDIGIGNGLAFPLDLSAPLILVPNENADLIQKMIGGRDSVTCGYRGPVEDSNVLKRALQVPLGTSAWVETIDLAINAATGGARSPSEENGACFGYHEVGGTWKFDFTEIPLSKDVAIARFKVQLPIRKGPIDAIKLLVSLSESAKLQTITLTARPTP